MGVPDDEVRQSAPGALGRPLGRAPGTPPEPQLEPSGSVTIGSKRHGLSNSTARGRAGINAIRAPLPASGIVADLRAHYGPDMDIHEQVEIEAPASTVWEVVGERFGDIARWTEFLDSSSLEGELGVGAVRTCRFQPNVFSRTGTIRERLTSFDRDAMRLSYEGIGMSAFMERAINPLNGHAAWS